MCRKYGRRKTLKTPTPTIALTIIVIAIGNDTPFFPRLAFLSWLEFWHFNVVAHQVDKMTFLEVGGK